MELSKFCRNMKWAQLRDNEKVSIRTIETPTHKKDMKTQRITCMYVCTEHAE